MTAGHDFLIVGAGLFGAVVAERLAAVGASVRVVEQYTRVGGLCASRRHPTTGERYCPFGTQVLATCDPRVGDYLTKVAPFVPYRHTVYSRVGGRLVSMPIDLAAIRTCYGDDAIDPVQAQQLVAADTAPYQDRPVTTVRDAALARFGPRLYDMFIRGYVTKQWGASPDTLPAAVLTDRFAIHHNQGPGYHRNTVWQGLPAHGYEDLFARLLASPRIDVVTGHHTRGPQDGFRHACVYTAPIDQFFDYRHGRLDRRTIHLRWRFEPRGVPAESVAVTCYPDEAVPYYRSHRPRHLPWNHHLRTPILLVGDEHPGKPPPGVDAGATVVRGPRTG